MPKPAYHRILIKLSGEALLGAYQAGIDPAACESFVQSVSALSNLSIQVAIVIGGGNFFRGAKSASKGMKRIPADQMGMLATVINAISLQQAFEKLGHKALVMSAFPCPFVETYCWKEAQERLVQNTVLIFAGGTGNPYFTTDSAAALRALEIQADVLMKATKVDGIYNKDPVKYPDAVKYDRISYTDVLKNNLQVMDAAAIALCREGGIPIRVFNLFARDALLKAVMNQSVGTLVEGP